ncbi:MAG: polysaccharide deacetylase family protein [Candidatus Firestonebacteria bacterium]
MNIPILMYHHVKNDPVPFEASFTVSIDNFEQQMQYLNNKKYNIITLEDLISAVKSNEKILAKTCVITFDDGYENFLDFAYPVLQKYNFVATVFLTSGCIGDISKWDAKYVNAKLLSKEQICELSKNGISFGSHSKTHPHFSKLNSDEILREIVESKKEIEGILGKRINTFSYPYNEYNFNIEKLVEKAGFDCACAIRSHNRTVTENVYALRRINVKNSDKLFQFSRKISRWYLWYRGIRRR